MTDLRQVTMMSLKDNVNIEQTVNHQFLPCNNNKNSLNLKFTLL